MNYSGRMNEYSVQFAHLSIFSLFLNCKFEIFEMEWEFSLNGKSVVKKKIKWMFFEF
jgi:hypothetical protein